MEDRIDFMVGFNQIAKKFFNSLPKELLSLIEVFRYKNQDVYIIGGAVRDFFLNLPAGDYDLATSALPEDIVKWLTDIGVKTKLIGGKFGTIMAIINKKAFDISTFRSEFFDQPGKPPKITFTKSIRIDLARRDFSINTIVFDPIRKQFADPYNGIIDIKNKEINVIGDVRVRLLEDGLRIIRLIRFSSHFNLKINEKTLSVINEIGYKAKFRSKTALSLELFKLLQIPAPSKGLILIWKSNILKAIFPSFPFINSSDYKSNTEIALDKLSEIPNEFALVRLFGFLLLLADPAICRQTDWIKVAQDLNLSKKNEQKLIRFYYSWSEFPKKIDNKFLKRWIRNTGIRTSIYFLQIIFLEAEAQQKEATLLERKTIENEVKKILEKKIRPFDYK